MAWFRCGGGKKLKIVDVPENMSYGEGLLVVKNFDLSEYGNVVGIVAIKSTAQANDYFLYSTNLQDNVLTMTWKRHRKNTGSQFGYRGLTILVEE